MSSVDVAMLDSPGLNFAVVKVPHEVIEQQSLADEFIAGAVLRLKCRVVLVGDKGKRKVGRPDLLGFLQYVNVKRLPWQRMDLL